jgi:uncharacterized protein DUF5615
MKLLADESVDRPIVERLRQDAHAVAYVAEMSPGTKDSEILDKANAHTNCSSLATRILASWCSARAKSMQE